MLYQYAFRFVSQKSILSSPGLCPVFNFPVAGLSMEMEWDSGSANGNRSGYRIYSQSSCVILSLLMEERSQGTGQSIYWLKMWYLPSVSRTLFGYLLKSDYARHFCCLMACLCLPWTVTCWSCCHFVCGLRIFLYVSVIEFNCAPFCHFGVIVCSCLGSSCWLYSQEENTSKWKQ